ncbi:MAG: hypothetical protein RLZZ133_1672 [Pseudomonadota bacterium]|jgi:hypothetical protein
MTDRQDPGDLRAAREGYRKGNALSDTEAGSGENRFLVMDFWEFAIISTLMIVFFPWSLLFCVFVYGMADTKLIVIALLHDWVKTVLAVLSVLVPFVVLVVGLVVWLIR